MAEVTETDELDAGHRVGTNRGRHFQAKPKKERGRRRFRLNRRVEWAIIIGLAVITALAVKAFLLQAFYIPSASMEPTLERNDRVLVNKLSYKLHDVNRGDVVVFERLDDVAGGESIRDLIKRVIALPGETIETRDGEVYINDRRLREPYVKDGLKTVPGIDKTKIPDGHFWVMGDNRANSRDSRFFGPIPESKIVGRAFVQVWPLLEFDFM